jgi:hypothetical protein
VELDMPFPVAGVGFRVQVGPGDETEGLTLLIGLRALEAGKTARFTRESSYPLGDFIGGFCRWLGTKGVQVLHPDEEVSGHFQPRYTVVQMLETLQELCEMLDDKFAGYPGSIVS